MAIMVVLMAIAMVSFLQWGRGTAMRSAIIVVKSNLVSARQWAITHRVPTHFICGNTNGVMAQNGFFVVTTNNASSGVIGTINYLQSRVQFSTTNDICFMLDGSCTGTTSLVTIGLTGQALTNSITVYALTGRATSH